MPTKIEWTEETWNPITGCTPISEGCQNCYARRMAKRLQAMGQVKYKDGFAVRVHDKVIYEPIDWRKPRRIFVCSMGDLMHEDVSGGAIRSVILTMTETPRHTYQILTKRPERLLKFAWPANCWVGVTVERAKYLDRIDTLRKVKAPLRFVSFEPLLERMGGVNLDGIRWAIAGAETGPGKRWMDPEWAESIRLDCYLHDRDAGVPFFFKRDSDGNRELSGRTYEEMPR